MCTHTHLHTPTHAHMPTRTHAHTHTRIYAHTRTQTRARAHTYALTHTHTHTCAHALTHIHTVVHGQPKKSVTKSKDTHANTHKEFHHTLFGHSHLFIFLNFCIKEPTCLRMIFYSHNHATSNCMSLLEKSPICVNIICKVPR